MRKHSLILLAVLFLYSASSADKYAGEFMYVGAGARAWPWGVPFPPWPMI